MSALINTIGLSDDKTSVTKISANARIDYILRFSKQAILVIDESPEQNGQITNQFIASIPEQHNAAYISLSTQFNDIQIRCRIIEQISAGELFDPEISLAVSVINLVKKSKQALTVVLDNTQYLSLQILHEVTQLAEIAKKANLIINVVMFGTPEAGIKIQENKSLFHNKLTLLSAQSGQLLPTNSTIFNRPKRQWYAIGINKWLLSFIIVLCCLAAATIVLLQQDSFNFTKPLKVESSPKVALAAVLAEPQPTVLSRANVTELKQQAQPNDVYLSLLAPEKVATVKKVEVLPATPGDIMTAMTSLSLADDTIESAEMLTSHTMENTNENSLALSAELIASKVPSVNNAYYLNSVDGFVIQIAVFRDLDLPAEFLASLQGIEFQIYQRLLNNVPVYVITSSVFDDKLTAKEALSTLSPEIIARQPWIKSLKVINSEINAFQVSQ